METQALSLHLAAKKQFDEADAAVQAFVREHCVFVSGGLARVFQERFRFRNVFERSRLEPELKELVRKRHEAALAFQNTMKSL